MNGIIQKEHSIYDTCLGSQSWPEKLYSRDPFSLFLCPAHSEPTLPLSSHDLPLPAFPMKNLFSGYYPSPVALSKEQRLSPLDLSL